MTAGLGVPSSSQTGTGTSSSRTESHASILLSREENQALFRLLGQRCQSLSTAVVQVRQIRSNTRTSVKLKELLEEVLSSTLINVSQV